MFCNPGFCQLVQIASGVSVATRASANWYRLLREVSVVTRASANWCRLLREVSVVTRASANWCRLLREVSVALRLPRNDGTEVESVGDEGQARSACPSSLIPRGHEAVIATARNEAGSNLFILAGPHCRRSGKQSVHPCRASLRTKREAICCWCRL
jgi:hypothetical protein